MEVIFHSHLFAYQLGITIVVEWIRLIIWFIRQVAAAVEYIIGRNINEHCVVYLTLCSNNTCSSGIDSKGNVLFCFGFIHCGVCSAMNEINRLVLLEKLFDSGSIGDVEVFTVNEDKIKIR